MTGTAHDGRCDACDTLFRLKAEPIMNDPSVSIDPPACSMCGSPHTRIVGQSGAPPLIHRQCDRCGQLFSRTLAGTNV
jgi:hypothetical protein